jgi:predicted transcriptional regulator
MREKWFFKMRRSKLEMHIDVLKALAHYGKVGSTRIMFEVNINCSVLKGCLDVLIKLKLVQKQVLHKKGRKARAAYTITEKGLTLLKNAAEINKAIPIVEEAAVANLLLQ